MKTTQKKFSEIIGVSKQRVGQWVSSGLITLDKNGKVDVDRARAQLANRLDGARRVDWEIGSGRKIQPKKLLLQKSAEAIEEYEVKKPFVERIDGKRYFIRVGTIMKVYSSRKGIQVAYFPAERR